MDSGRRYDEYYSRQGPGLGEAASPELSVFLKRKRCDGKALDLGAGEGRNSLHLARLGYSVTAVDVSEVGLRQLEDVARQHRLDDRIQTIRADARKLSLPRQEFDLIVAETVLDHIQRYEIEPLFHRLAGWLRPSGSTYIKVHTVDDPGNHDDARATSELAPLVAYYFRSNELLSLVLDRLHVSWHSEQPEIDTTHGRPHEHVFAKIWAENEALVESNGGHGASRG